MISCKQCNALFRKVAKYCNALNCTSLKVYFFLKKSLYPPVREVLFKKGIYGDQLLPLHYSSKMGRYTICILADKVCVYCGVEFTPSKISKKTASSWEHIINDAKIITIENIALCCCSCNASKGAKILSDWLQSKYCIERKINQDTVSPIIMDAIRNGQQLNRVRKTYAYSNPQNFPSIWRSQKITNC